MSTEESNVDTKDFLFLPAVSGEGVLVRRSQIIGARPNGHEGAIVYANGSGPSMYTSMTTRQIADLLGAKLIKATS